MVIRARVRVWWENKILLTNYLPGQPYRLVFRVVSASTGRHDLQQLLHEIYGMNMYTDQGPLKLVGHFDEENERVAVYDCVLNQYNADLNPLRNYSKWVPREHIIVIQHLLIVDPIDVKAIYFGTTLEPH